MEIWAEQDIMEPIATHTIENPLVAVQGETVKVGVITKQNGEDIELPGAIRGYVTLSDGNEIMITDGLIFENRASVILNESCLSVPGNISITINVNNADICYFNGIVQGGGDLNAGA